MLSTLAKTIRTRSTERSAGRAAIREKLLGIGGDQSDLATIARTMAIQVASDRVSGLGRRSSVRSRRSLFSVLGYRSALSAVSVWSLASVGSIGSIGSAGAILSVGSAGSVLSVGSAGSILSVGAAGSIGSVGGSGDWPGREPVHDSSETSSGTDVARISGLMAVAAVIAAGAANFRRAG